MEVMRVFLARHIRKIIYAAAVLWAVRLYSAVPAYLSYAQPPAASFLIRPFALTALALLSIALTPGLIRVFFPRFPFNTILIVARRAIGVSAFFFAALHGIFALALQFNWNPLQFLLFPARYQFGFFAGEIALLILFALAATSFDRIVQKMGYAKWKTLHRFVYLAILLTVLHALIIGSDFQDKRGAPTLFLKTITLAYITLELAATARVLSQRENKGTKVTNG